MLQNASLGEVAMLGHLAAEDGTLAPSHEIEFHAHEISFVCDRLEVYLDDNAGFDLVLFRSCKRLLDTYQADMSEYKAEDEQHARTALLQALYYSKGKLTVHQRLGILLDEPWSSRPAMALFVFLTLCVAVSCVSVVVATLPAFNPLVRPNMNYLWVFIDWATTAVFTIETALRLYVSVEDPTLPVTKVQRMLRFLRDPYNLVDIVALVPTYLQQVVPASSRIITGQLRTVRLLRFFRFLRRYKPVRMLLKGLWTSAYALIAPAICYTMFLVFLSSLAYFAEGGDYDTSSHQFLLPDTMCQSEPGYFVPPQTRLPYLYNSSTGVMQPNITIPIGAVINFTCPPLLSKFLTITQACWFGVATFSTNGFGDFVPITGLGKFVSVVMLAAGLMIAAMPLAVVDASYVTVLQRERERDECLREGAAMRNAEVNTKALLSSLERGEDHRTPGEALLLTFWSLTGLKVLDLVSPRKQHLMVLDLLIESAVKQLVNAAFEHRQLRPPFMSAASSQISVWVATTTTNTAWESCCSTRLSNDPGVRTVEHSVLTSPFVAVLGSEAPPRGPSGSQRSGGPPAAVGGGNIFSLELLQRLEQHRHDSMKAAAKGTSAAFATALGEARVPPLRLLIATEHARIVLFSSWGVTRALLQAFPSCVVKIYRRKGMIGTTMLVDVIRVTEQCASADRNVAYNFCPSQTAELSNQLLLRLRERVETTLVRRTPETPHDAACASAASGEPIEGGEGGPQPGLSVVPGQQHFDEMNRFALLQQAQSAAEDAVDDEPADYAEAAEVLQTEPGYFHLLDGDVVQFGGSAVGDHRERVSKFMAAFEDSALAGTAGDALVDMAAQISDAIFYMVRV
jgi:hypothetical protein